MSVFKPTLAEIQFILLQLEQALYSHERWYESLVATLVCRLQCDRNDLEEESYRKCRFGQWLYDQGEHLLQDHPSLPAIEGEHRRMHQLACRLLQGAISGATTVADYEMFANVLRALRLEITTLQRELEGLQGNLDPLTGAYNRTSMLTFLREQQLLVKRQVMACSLAMMDVDHFKNINDQFGHVVGDQVLIAVVRYALEHLRPYDRMFRYGGEEFVISMLNTTVDQALSVITRLCEGLASAPISTSEQTIKVSASFGVVPLDPELSVEDAVNRADQAMYAAKRAGRNCVRAF